MSTSGKLDILLHGLGAIGSFYAFILQRSPRVRLSVVARSNYEAVKANGVTIRSANHGSHTFKPFQVLQTPGDATQKFDYVVCANKAIGVEAICQALKPVVREGETAFALMQNGVGIEEEFQRVWPSCTVLSGVVSHG
jgi:ketopantoate reductase